MSDQASKLRELAGSAGPKGPSKSSGIPMVAVTGSRAGVGATTVAMNLAAALSDRGERVVLIDAAESIRGKRAGARTATSRFMAQANAALAE